MALNNNYVKFVRGSATAWAALTEKSADTLYFITTYGDNNEILKTEMYLGEQLISDGAIEQAPVNVQLALKELTDVDIADSIVLEDGMFLGYNATTGQWEPRTQTEVTVDTMTGASSSTAGAAGLVPAPAAGDEKKVLTGDGNWTELSIPDTSSLETQMATLIGTDENLSIREIAANELATQLIPENAAESLNELKEIATWIQEHPEDASAMNLAIQDLEKAVFDKTPRVDEEGNPVLDETTGEQIIDKISKVGNLEELLNEVKEDVVVTSTSIEQLETLLGAQKDDSGALTGLTAVDKITAIETALGLEKDEESGSIIITSAPIGKLEELLLVKNAQEGEEVPTSLVEAINILTEQMTWGNLTETQ